MTSDLPDPSNLLEHALAYLGRGWSVFPVTIKGDGQYKKPAVKWGHLQQRLPTPAELRSMFIRPKLTGLAVALGLASDGLYCRDFDDAAAYQRWADAHPELAKSLPTVSAKRGPHVYFRSTQKLPTKKYVDGEMRGLGGYAILPPSVHQSGHVYQWIVPLPQGELPVVDPREAGFCQNWIGTNEGKSLGCSEGTERTENTEEHTAHTRHTASVRSVLSVPSRGSDWGELVNLAVPTEKHNTNKRVFLLARGVRALEKQRRQELSQIELREIFSAWYERAKPFLREDQSRDDYWFEFLYGYNRVKFPLGEEVIERAWIRARNSRPPTIAEQFEQQETRLLVSLCRELQRIAGSEPFYLSCRTVQRLFHHETHTTGARWLRGLCLSKIIEVVVPGGPDTNKASRYKYLRPLDEGA